MTPPPSQRNRAHNFRIVGTISNDTESLEWEPIESKLLVAAAYVAPRRILYAMVIGEFAKSCCDRSLVQAPAVFLPPVGSKI
jgi:hypothetical protein